jgi:hypothetical protein
MVKRQTTVSKNGRQPDPQPTPGKQWRQPREEGYVRTLFSGNVVRLRPLDLATMLVEGEIPDLLTGLVYQVLFEGVDAPGYVPPAPHGEESKQTVFGITPTILPVVNLVCKAAFLQPRIVDNPQTDDEIAMEDVELRDRALVFNLVTQGADALRRFHYQPPPALAPVPDRQDLEPEAEPVSPGGERMGEPDV